MQKRVLPLLLISLLLLIGCATYAPQYRPIEETYRYPKDKSIEKTFYLIGDAGYSPIGGMSTGLQVFENYLKDKDTEGQFAIFLGDNIYPDGMPPINAPDRAATEYRLDAQIAAIQGFEGQVYFIPGNHDWYNEGLLGLKRQEMYFERRLGDYNVFQPTNGCPLQSVSVTDNIQLIMIDSQWYLEDWNVHPTINKDCDIKSREKFFIELELELEKHKNKSIVFAMHHPMFTNGTHGGYFGAEKHLFPTQQNIPMPGLASLVAQIRAQGGVSVQDRYNELSNKFMNKLANIVKRHGKLVFASGHEHTLQHIEEDGLIQIQTGSGAKSGFAALGKNGLFSYGGQGFAVYDLYTDGSSYVRYYGADDQMQPKLLFEKSIFEPKKDYSFNTNSQAYPERVQVPIYTPDSIVEAQFFKTIWGRKYRDVYAKPISAEVAILDSMYGGLRVIRDNNTDDYKSLLLADPAGNLYNMRALQKQALRYVNEIGEL
ncbi:MAG: metallophosphoesterase, partial [Marinirhabdus sp.]|nr:metallophosphoesterase [Marinirhabdus sp.]